MSKQAGRQVEWALGTLLGAVAVITLLLWGVSRAAGAGNYPTFTRASGGTVSVRLGDNGTVNAFVPFGTGSILYLDNGTSQIVNESFATVQGVLGCKLFTLTAASGGGNLCVVAAKRAFAAADPAGNVTLSVGNRGWFVNQSLAATLLILDP